MGAHRQHRMQRAIPVVDRPFHARAATISGDMPSMSSTSIIPPPVEMAIIA
jgi:hypothetical protein